MKIYWILALLAATTMACAREENSNFSFQKSSADIRYESIDAQGNFTDNQIISDPMREKYDRAEWLATKRSTVTSITGTATTNHVNVVFVGDGYTNSEMVRYSIDVIDNVEKMLKTEPYKSYANYFSFHRVDVVSQESGVSDGVSIVKKTALEMTYNCGGIARLLCVNTNKAAAEAANAKVVDVILALANSDTYGGAGYLSPAIGTMAARNANSFEVAMHELGHSFGGLTDEYEYAGATVNCDSFANTSVLEKAAMLARKVKWFRWLDLQQVGTFPGSCYASQFYRPTANSKMRVLGQPYDVVNNEQIILKIYQKVKPIESALAPGKYKSGIFWVKPMEPLSHKLSVSWSVDGVAQTELNGKLQLDPTKISLKSGKHTVSVTVTDNTTAVRDPAARAKYMSQTLTWTLSK